EDHVHTLQHEALLVVLERQDALAAQNARAFLLHEVLHPGKKLFGVERLLERKRDRLHLLIVIVLETAAMVAVVIVVVMMVMVMMVLMAVLVMMTMIMAVLVMLGLQELRLDIEDAIEIEGIAPQHLGQRNLAAFGGMQLGVGIDAADARLDVSQLLGL